MSMDTPPQISVVLPTFNREKILNKTINNIVAQSFQEFELIIVDDYSTDDTKSIVEKWCKQDRRIKYFCTPQNIGCAKSREFGVNLCTCNIITFIDDDDQWVADKLMKQYDALIHTNNDMIISDYHIKQNNNLIYKSMEEFGTNFQYEILKRPGPFFQSIMIKKNCLNKMKHEAISLNMFDNSAIPSEDWDFFINLSKCKPIVGYIPEPLFIWHVHNANQSLNLLREAEALAYIVDKHYAYIKTINGSSNISQHFRRIARLYEKKYDDQKTDKNIVKFYTRAFKENPLSIKNIFYWIMIVLGYKRTKSIILWVRKIRGLQNV